MDLSMDDELPTFRPFTRDELQTIENRIFENKLNAKKKQEKKDKNIAVRHNFHLYLPFLELDNLDDKSPTKPPKTHHKVQMQK